MSISITKDTTLNELLNALIRPFLGLKDAYDLSKPLTIPESEDLGPIQAALEEVRGISDEELLKAEKALVEVQLEYTKQRLAQQIELEAKADELLEGINGYLNKPVLDDIGSDYEGFFNYATNNIKSFKGGLIIADFYKIEIETFTTRLEQLEKGEITALSIRDREINSLLTRISDIEAEAQKNQEYFTKKNRFLKEINKVLNPYPKKPRKPTITVVPDKLNDGETQTTMDLDSLPVVESAFSEWNSQADNIGFEHLQEG